MTLTAERRQTRPTVARARRDRSFTLHASDVTGNVFADIRNVHFDTPAGQVAQAISARMLLPQNLPYTLRLDTTGQFVQDDAPIGGQVEPDSNVVVTPKAKLGG